MPALEAMASGLPVIATAGGPTDEFVPEAAGWRIPSTLRHLPGNQVDQWQTASAPFMLEPDVEALRDLMIEADGDREGRRLRGLAGREAAGGLTWDAVAERYRQRIALMASRPPRALSEPTAPFPLDGDARAKLLAMPAWLGEDRLGDLLWAWTSATRPGQSACLYLVADRRLHGDTFRHIDAADRILDHLILPDERRLSPSGDQVVINPTHQQIRDDEEAGDEKQAIQRGFSRGVLRAS